MHWPEVEGNPLAFIAQVDFSDLQGLTHFDIAEAGMLSFFLNLSQIEDDSAYKGNEMYFFGNSIKVLNISTEAKLVEKEPPVNLIENHRFKEGKIAFKDKIMPFPPEVFPSLELEENEAYFDDYCDLEVYSGVMGMLFHPFSYQLNLLRDYANIEEAQNIAVDKRGDIITLLTFDTYDQNGTFHYLDDIGFKAGYFGIKIQDLIQQNFDQVIFCFQS